MVRVRLIVLTTLVALLAPWVALCMTTGPAGHVQMPCCKTAAPGDRSARPCCASADPASLVPAQASATVAPPPSTSIAAIVPASSFTMRRHAPTAPFPALQLQLRSTVLLI